MTATNAKPITLYMAVDAPCEAEHPATAAVVLDAEFLAKLARLREVASASGLAYAVVYDNSPAWGNADDWDIRYTDLRVSADHWYFNGSPKHADYTVETRYLDFEEMESLIAEARQNRVSYVLHECATDCVKAEGFKLPRSAKAATA